LFGEDDDKHSFKYNKLIETSEDMDSSDEYRRFYNIISGLKLEGDYKILIKVPTHK